MKEFYRETKFKEDSRTLIVQCNDIVDDYLGQGLRLTLRQLYYQLVSKNIIPNSERSYKNIGSLVSNARLSGLMDWDAIEDRVRQPVKPPEFDNLEDLVDAALSSFRLPRWKGQENYAELWVEKDALAGVLRPIAREHHVTLMVNRGYSSQSAMYESAKRYIQAQDSDAVNLILFYLGDHDPSGEDMVRDIRDRMEMFDVLDLDVRKIALTMDQIKQYDPPPNPAKLTDPRAQAYIDKFGQHSWEVDALPPNVLARLIRKALKSVIDEDALQEVLDKEEEDKRRLKEALESLSESSEE